MTASEDSAGAAGGARMAVLTVFLPFACGYFLSYLFRNVNAVIAPRLMADLDLLAGDLGLLTAAYFLSFAAFQTPLGLLLDRYGPRRVQVLLLLVAALGALVFGMSQNQAMLIAGRALIGLGVSGCLMCAFKAITLWFPPARWPLVNGCFVAMGGLGAIVATRPVEMVLAFTDWRGLFYGLAACCLAVSLLILLAVPERNSGDRPSRLSVALRELGHVYADRFFWRLAPLGMAVTGTSMAVLGLWGGPWLKDVAALGPDAVANVLLAGAAAMAAGAVLSGLLADQAERRGISIEWVIAIGVLICMVSQAMIAFEIWTGALLPWLLLGLTANTALLNYARLSQHFPPAYAGRANTAINMLIFLAAFAVQWGMGGIMDLAVAGGGAGAGEGYPAGAYAWAFGAMLVLQVLTWLWFLLAPDGR